ncbi:MAG TPA: DPP IV N-terminal domain-containing protein [bacterium]|nr:DPP IV N-terminal domain-containing protein [bacterium]
MSIRSSVTLGAVVLLSMLPPSVGRCAMPPVPTEGGGVPPQLAGAGQTPLTIERIYGDTSLSGISPRGVKISPDGRRVGFLRGRSDDQYQLDLWVYDARDHRSRRLVDSKSLLPSERLSDIEKARRERARTASFRGILSYHWSPDGKRLLFPLGDTIYLYDIGARAPLRALTARGDILDPQISPKGNYASFVREQDLVVIDLQTGRERQLTFDGDGTVHNAEAEFIAQEEMGQSHGYWWSPDDAWIAFKQFDEAPVPIIRRFEVYPESTTVVEQRYPTAGEANVTVRLGLVRPTGGDVAWVDLGPDPDIYLARVDWLPDSRTVSFQRQSRDQKRLDLVFVDAATLAQRVVLTETSETWVNLNDDLRFLKRRPAFVWSSERSGFNHLYLYNLDGALIRPLTEGDWDVDGLLAVDEESGLVYFSSNRDAVTDKQIYTAPYATDELAAPTRISASDGWHDASFARDADRVLLFVDRFNDPATPPQTSVRGPDGRFLAWIEENRLGPGHPYWPYAAGHVIPDFGTIPAEDGQPLVYGLCKPANFDPAKRYPVHVSVYGGPGSQGVTRTWGDPFTQYLLQQGYIVFELDNRGTGRRGRRFADALYHRLGDIEVRDQVAGIRWLKGQPYVDPERIGVSGWSYGGYMAVMLLAKASDEIAAGIAGAPVTDWRIYDTHYTEHYLGRPQDNPDGYDSSSVFNVLAGLRSPLLLIHGMADDNVLFTNSTQLMAALISQGPQFHLMTYPGGKHGLSTPAMQRHSHHLMVDFLEDEMVRRR